MNFLSGDVPNHNTEIVTDLLTFTSISGILTYAATQRMLDAVIRETRQRACL